MHNRKEEVRAKKRVDNRKDGSSGSSAADFDSDLIMCGVIIKMSTEWDLVHA